MKRELLIAKYNRQVEVYGDLIVLLEILKEELKQFDGKQITVRIEKKLKEHDLFKNRYVKISENIVGRKILLISSIFDRCVTINGKSQHIDRYQLDLDLQEEKGDKFDYNYILKKIENDMKCYSDSVKSINYTLENIDTMIKEYNEIQELMKVYNDKYNYSLTSDMGTRFKVY